MKPKGRIYSALTAYSPISLVVGERDDVALVRESTRHDALKAL